MRDDLLESQAAVDWAVSQILLFAEAFRSWDRDHSYKLRFEPYSDPGGKLAVAYFDPLPRTFNAWVGAIANSLRSSLDLLAAALATRNGVKPKENTHFPIFSSDQVMIDPLEGIEGKKWLCKSERAIIKSLKPYKGGDHTIWPLHHLDIRRKHERLIRASIDPRFHLEFGNAASGKGAFTLAGMTGIERFDDKTVLGSVPNFALSLADRHVRLAMQITFNEVIAGLAGHEATTTLDRFAGRVAEIIGQFDYS
jgi:hypothetical protein